MPFIESQNYPNVLLKVESKTSLSGVMSYGGPPQMFGRVETNTTLTGTLRIRTPNATVSTQTTIRGNLSVSGPEYDELLLLIDVSENPVEGDGKTYSARVEADGEKIAIKSFSHNEPSANAGESVAAALSFPSDRPLVDAAENFKFELYDNDVWKTIFNLGKRAGVGFDLQFRNDRAEFSTIGPVVEKLNFTPEQSIILYDPLKDELNANDFKIVYDSNGGIYQQVLRQVPNLDIKRLFKIMFVEYAGFAAVKTTIKNFPIRRCDCDYQTSIWDAVAGHIAGFRPVPVVIGSTLWILDTTTAFPSGFPLPVAITADDFESASLSYSETLIDGYNVQYSVNENDFSESEPLEKTDSFETGTFGESSYRTTDTTESYTVYKRKGQIIHTELNEVETEINLAGGITISRDTETRTFDGFRRVIRTESDIRARVPDLTVTPGGPGYGQLVFMPVEEMTKIYEYAPDRFDTKRKIVKRILTSRRKLIIIDSTNQYIGNAGFGAPVDFKQDFMTAFRSGNLKDGQTAEFAEVEQVTQTIFQKPDGQLESKTIIHDLLRDVTTPPQIEPIAAGDISFNAQTTATGEFVVLRNGAPRTNRKLVNLPVAEIPFRIWEPLAKRLLERQNRLSGSVVLFGLRLDLRRGLPVELFDESGASVGKFLIIGRTITGENLGTRNQKTRTTIEVLQI